MNFSKEDMLKILRQQQPIDLELEQYANDNWNSAVDLSKRVLERMPSIGLLSKKKRYAAFLVACIALQKEIEHGSADEELASLSMLILRMFSKDFAKAFDVFLSFYNSGYVCQSDFEEKECYQFLVSWIISSDL